MYKVTSDLLPLALTKKKFKFLKGQNNKFLGMLSEVSFSTNYCIIKLEHAVMLNYSTSEDIFTLN